MGEWEGGMGIGGWPKSVAVWAYRLTECTAVRRVGPSPSSDALLVACLAADPMCKVACKTAERDSMVMVAGEITTQAEREGLGSRTQALVRNSDHRVVDAMLDACLTADPVSKVAYETATKDSMAKMAFGNHEKTKVNLLREMELNITGGQEEYLEKESGEHGEHESSKPPRTMLASAPTMGLASMASTSPASRPRTRLASTPRTSPLSTAIRVKAQPTACSLAYRP